MKTSNASTSTVYESGATSHAVNDLILFADNTRELAAARDLIYSAFVGNESSRYPLSDRFESLISPAIAKYRKELNEPNAFSNMSLSECREFCNLYATDFENWKYENGIA